MSFAEVQQSITKMSIEERREIAALIAHLERMDDPEFQSELDGRMAAMDKGRKHSLEEFEKLHEKLSKEGR